MSAESLQTATTMTPSTIAVLNQYKAKVRDIAIEAVNKGDLCRDGINPHLVKLGIEPLPAPAKYHFDIPVTAVARMSFKAADEKAALADLEDWKKRYGKDYLQYANVVDMVQAGEPVVTLDTEIEF